MSDDRFRCVKERMKLPGRIPRTVPRADSTDGLRRLVDGFDDGTLHRKQHHASDDQQDRSHFPKIHRFTEHEPSQQDRDQAAEEEEFLREQRKHEAQKSDKAATNTRIRIDNGLKVGAARLTL